MVNEDTSKYYYDGDENNLANDSDATAANHVDFLFFFNVSGLVAEGEKAQKQTGGLVVTKDLMGNTQHTHDEL